MTITILDAAPAILTKDSEWARKTDSILKSGSIIVLPEDAVLIKSKEQ